VTQQRHPLKVANVGASSSETFGRYRLLALLGQGGMGRLYLAERRGIEGFVKIVALKRILPHLSDSAQLKEMFLNEARVAARLEHPNIATTYELGEIDGTYFISMEYLPGEDLAATLARCQGEQRIPVDIAAALAQQAAHALHYAHEISDDKGRRVELVHRDVNPNNIFITYHGVVKLLDFGVAKDPKTRKSLPGVFKGKYAYCAPEQLEGGKVDRRTDVFSLGIVLWECLTGSHLFDAATEAQIIDAVRSRRIEAPSLLRPEVPTALDEIALRALERDPARRYQSAQDMAEDLERFLLEREPRPASKKIGRWLESIFGAERAALKRSLSQGGAAERSLERLAELDVAKPALEETSRPSGNLATVRPRALWSTNFTPKETTGAPRTQPPTSAQASAPIPQSGSDHGAPRTAGPISRTRITSSPIEADLVPVSTELPPLATSAGSAAPGRRVGTVAIAALGAVVLAVGLGVAALSKFSSKTAGDEGPAPAGLAAAVLDVRSSPPGAHIFVDGSPSGLKTPAVLRSLPTTRGLEIRLDLPGYATASETVQLADGQTRLLNLTLRDAAVDVRLSGVPEAAAVYVDDVRVDGSKPVPMAVGSRRVRVEAGGSEVFSRTVEVKAGPAITLDISSSGSKP
jgi:serine/threonine-protein kinase